MRRIEGHDFFSRISSADIIQSKDRIILMVCVWEDTRKTGL